jgi:lipopolysaccharide assembly outer membrane protein LptD (OstA)
MKLLLSILCAVSTLCAQTIVQSDEAAYCDDKVHLKGHVYVSSDMGKLNADEAFLHTQHQDETWQATHIILIGNVKMVDETKTQYALAHRVEIFPKERVMVFEAGVDDKVLFLDVGRQMQLAAHKIRACRSDTDSVQGYGDVRCVLGADELDRMRTLFSLESP